LTLKSNAKATGIDLYSMSKGIVDNSFNKKAKKKVKTPFSKNLFTLGFDPGFTKALIKANYISSVVKKKTTKQSVKINLIFNKNTSTSNSTLKKKK
jgi:hypothetical protein